MNEEKYIKTVNEDGSILFTPKKKFKLFQPKNNEQCCIMRAHGGFDNVTWSDRYHNHAAVNAFICFQTKKLARKADAIYRRDRAIAMACMIVDPNYKPDWDDGSETKWFVFNYLGNWSLDSTERSRYTSAAVSTKEKAEQVCELLTDLGIE